MTSGIALGHADEFTAFLALAEAGSFTGAGQALGRHATLVTKRVQALEARLGVRLVERTTRRVRLTDVGSRLAAKLRLAADLVQEAQDEATATRTSIQGRVRLSLPGTMGRLWLAPRIPDLLERHPGLHVEAHYSDAFVDLVRGGFDAAVRIGHLPDSTLVARKLAGHRRILCASPAYLERYGTPERPEDLAEHNCLEFTGLTSFPYWHLTDGMRSAKVEVRGRLRGNDTMALLEAARAGVGILGAGEWATVRDVASGDLVLVLPEWTFDVEAGIHLVRPSAAFTPARTQAVVEWIEELFRSGPPWTSGSSPPA